MKKIVILGLTVYTVTLTVLVIRNTVNTHYLNQATWDLLEYLKQKQVDEEFAIIVEDLDDPEI